MDRFEFIELNNEVEVKPAPPTKPKRPKPVKKDCKPKVKNPYDEEVAEILIADAVRSTYGNYNQDDITYKRSK